MRGHGSRVITVAFYGDRIYKIGLVFCGIQGFYSFLNQYIIRWPVAVWCVLCDVHQLFTGKGIESHHGKSVVSAVESRGIIVNYMCSVTDL